MNKTKTFNKWENTGLLNQDFSEEEQEKREEELAYLLEASTIYLLETKQDLNKELIACAMPLIMKIYVETRDCDFIRIIDELERWSKGPMISLVHSLGQVEFADEHVIEQFFIGYIQKWHEKTIDY